MARSARVVLSQIHAYFSQFRGFNRDIKLLLTINFFASVVMGLSSIIQPLFFDALGYDSAVVGVLLGVSALVSVLVLVPAGLIADRYGRKSVLFFSILTYALGFVIHAISTDFLSLLIASGFIGVSWGTYIGPSNAILTDKTGLKERNFVFSFYSFLSASAIIIGSLLAGATEVATSVLGQAPLEAFKTMFWAAAVFTLICLPVLSLVKEAPPTRHRKGALTIRSWRLIGAFSIVNGLVGFGAGAFIPLLPLYLSSKFSANKAEIGILFAFSNAAMGVANLLAPKLSERIGQVTTIALTQGVSVIPLLLIPSSGAFHVAALLHIVRTALMNMSAPILNAYTMSTVSRDERASASGVITMAWNGANAAGTAASGVLMALYLDFPIYAGSLFYVMSTVFFYAYFQGKRQGLVE